ncbi:MAG: fimbrillin family protein [Candidatus Cryptobacteroides sp.]
MAAVCILVASCSKTSADQSPLGRSLIGFTTVSTKAASAYPAESPFITTSYKLASGKTWDANKAEASTFIFINQEEVSYNTTYNYWKTAADYYWPTDGSTLTFFSYSPTTLKGSKTSVSVEGVSISSWDVTSNSGDILVADIAQDKTKNESLAGYTGVPTNFRQKLSKIVFRFRIADEADANTQVKVNSISLKDVYSAGSYSRGGYSDDKWTPSSTSLKSKGWSLYSGSFDIARGSFSVEQKFNMIPQRLVASASAHPILEIGYSISTDGGSSWKSKTASCYFDENLRQEEWEKGKKYSYNIYIGVGQYPIDFDASVVDWTDYDDGLKVPIGG